MPAVDSPRFVPQVQRGVLAEEIHIRFPQRLNRSDVLPVAREGIRHHLLTRRQHCGNDVLAEVVGGLGVLVVLAQVFLQFVFVEDIDAHRCLGGIGILRFFAELIDLPVLARAHDTEAARFLNRHVDDRNRAVRLCLLMEIQHSRVVHFIDMVARENQDILCVVAVDELHVLPDGICCSLIPVRAVLPLIGRQNLDPAEGAVEIPRQTVADVVVEDQRLILRQNTYGVHSGIDAVGKREINDAVLAAKRHRRLCGLFGQRVKPAALPARKQHGNTFFFLEHNNLRFL